MTESAAPKSFKEKISIISHELILGTLVAILSIITAVSAYQSSMADSDQTKYNVQGQQMLTNANAEYLSANQYIGYDYSLYDSWFTSTETEKADYFQSQFSESLQKSLTANADDPFNETYYNAMYEGPQGMFDQADELFKKAEQFNERGDALQLVMLVSALGLAFAAWGALLKEDSFVRILFAVMAIAMLIYSVTLYLGVPTVAAMAA
jgi:hypothetical protein